MAGAGYKLFNTGDVLTAAQVNTYLQEQAVMRFANSTARTTALSGVLAEGMMSYLDDTNSVEVYNGSAWVSVGNTGDITEVLAGTGISGGGTSGSVTITNSMATAIDAKGDLIVGTGADAFSRLAVSATDGHVLKVKASTSTGLEWGAPETGGTFTTWTPTRTNWTLGNGTETARYTQSGKFVYLEYKLIWGSTSTISGIWQTTLPVASASGFADFIGGDVFVLDAGSKYYTAKVFQEGSTTAFRIAFLKADTTYIDSWQVLNNTSPFTLATNDTIWIKYTYEAA